MFKQSFECIGKYCSLGTIYLQKFTEYLTKLYNRPSLLLVSIKSIRKWLYRKSILRPYSIIRKYILAFLPFHPPTKIFVASKIEPPDYIIWGVIDWHFRHQRPQQLAKVLAETGRRVFYVSSNFQDDERAGFDIEPLDTSGCLFQIKLFVKSPPIIYFTSPTTEAVDQLRGSIGQLLGWADVGNVISFVQHSFWYDIARVIPNGRLVYDCMDHHEGFGNNSNDVLSLELLLLRDAELTVTTSAWLDQLAAKYSQRRALIRNACDFKHFEHKPEIIYSDRKGRRIIGYYGAIADWFDLELVEAIAIRFSECCILLVGADTVGAQLRLAHLTNVIFTGEAAYADLTYYLYAFDVALLPFKVIQLTLATNPVKVYEYLAAGKPVVSVNLPETTEFGDLICVAKSTTEFLLAIANVLNSQDSRQEIARRQEFAKQQTWGHRAQALIALAENHSHDPVISVVVLTYNNLELTRSCLYSLDKHSDYANMEIIVVDNASSDGSREFLKQWQLSGSNRRLILNDTNRGFAAANNQGLFIAEGEYLVMLNNDTYVTPGWIRTLYQHFKYDKAIGLVGPVTNNIGNEAKIDIDYKDMDQMLEVSSKYTHKHLGKVFQLRSAAFFCAMMPRVVYNLVGPLDEEFGLGFFEDDDYCRRIERAGLHIVCAEDVFIHHHLSASFLKLDRDARRSLFNENKKKYEDKWGHWKPHNYRKKRF